MKKLLLGSILLGYSAMAIDLGNLATASKTGAYYQMGKDLTELLSQYNINLKPVNTDGSFENMSILDGHAVKHKNTYFAIVQKDSISYYNYTQRLNSGKSIFKKIPAILSLGTEQIHIFTAKDNNFNFKTRKSYKIYCGKRESGSCITAEYIEKAYNFDFKYVNTSSDNLEEKLKKGELDLFISVITAPAKKYENRKNVKLIELPNNLIMDTMYTTSTLNTNTYNWLDVPTKVFSVQKVLMTNLNKKKYEVVIDSIVKVILLKRDSLKEKNPKLWKDVDFSYMSYKYFSPISRNIVSHTFQKTF